MIGLFGLKFDRKEMHRSIVMSRLSTQDLFEVNIEAIQGNTTVSENRRQELKSLCELAGHIEDVNSHEQFMDFFKKFSEIFLMRSISFPAFKLGLRSEAVNARTFVSEYGCEQENGEFFGSSLKPSWEDLAYAVKHRIRNFAIPYCRIQLEERKKEKMQQGTVCFVLTNFLRNLPDIFPDNINHDHIKGLVLLFFMPNGFESSTENALETCKLSENFLLSQRQRTSSEETEILNDSVNNISFLNS